MYTLQRKYMACYFLSISTTSLNDPLFHQTKIGPSTLHDGLRLTDSVHIGFNLGFILCILALIIGFILRIFF